VKAISLVVLLMFVFSPSAFAQWKLIAEQSNINFVSIKKSKVGEVHSFTKLDGSIDESGAVEVKIGLGSVETNIDIRNERMRTMLFETSKFMEAVVGGSVDVGRLSSLGVGETYADSVKLRLSLHGVSGQVASDVQVTKLSGDRILVSSLQPIIISAEEYGLDKGVEMLRTVAKLPSISTAVPVTYSLMFGK